MLRDPTHILHVTTTAERSYKHPTHSYEIEYPVA